MDIGSIFLALALLLLVAAFVARPIVERAAHRNDAPANSPADDLIAGREAMLVELRDLDFEHSTGKVADDDYRTQRARLVIKGAEILRAIDQLPTPPAPRLWRGIRAAVRVTNTARTPPLAGHTRSGAGNPSQSLDDEIEQLIAARRQGRGKTQVTRGAAASIQSSGFCPQCGQPVVANDKFCAHCGAKISVAEAGAMSWFIHQAARGKQYGLRITLYAAALLITLTLTSCSLAEDVTPPPGYESNLPEPVPTAATVEIGYPLTAPSVALGASVYAEKCVRCHSPNGDGQGELAAQLQFPPANFTDPVLVANTTPRRWADIVTNGNLEKFMPPWGDSLSESQRWNLVAYLYSFSAPPERLETGKAIYEANCAKCHGGDGQGDGKLPDFTNQEYMAEKSNRDFLDSLAKPDHNFADKLSAADLLAAVDYTRALSFDFREPEIAQGTVTGQLTNGTTGSAVPAGQPVELHIFDNFEETDTLTAELAADGSFEFTGIEPKPGRALIVTTHYAGVLYASDVAESSPDQPDYQLPITVYDSTTDPSAITVDRMHIVFEFGSGAVQVGELFLLSNTGDKTLRPEAEGGYTASFALPSGYIDLAFQDGELGDIYVPTADGFADTSPLRPGEGVRQILASFKLAYTDSLKFTQTIIYPAAVVNILLPEAGVTLTGSNIVDGGVQDLQGSSFHMYTLANVNAGDTLTFELKGKPQVASAASGEPTSSEPTAVAPAFDLRSASIGGLSLALAIAIVTYGWVQRKEGVGVRATSNRNTTRREELLTEIAELDEGFENGEYPESDYRKEREKLKAQLKRLMEKDYNPPPSRT